MRIQCSTVSRLAALVLLACTLSLTFGSSAALAQFDSASVVGTVRDASGSVLPGAKVTLTNVDTSISVVKTAGDDGNYEFAAVKPGTYVVTGEKAGFALALVDNVRVQVSARLRVDHRTLNGKSVGRGRPRPLLVGARRGRCRSPATARGSGHPPTSHSGRR